MSGQIEFRSFSHGGCIMIFDKDGMPVRDIDIDELRISYGGHYGKEIVLTKDKISCRNAVHPTIAYMNFPEGHFDVKELTISEKQFLQLSDAIHNAGLLELLRKPCEHNMYPGAIYQTMHCMFDDCSQYEYMTRNTPDKEFNDIVQILLPLCDFPQDNLLPYQDKPVPKIEYYETLCCNEVVQNNWSFCPRCGKMITPLDRTETSKVLDMDETLWLCEICNEGIPMIYKYCGRCGSKRKW